MNIVMREQLFIEHFRNRGLNISMEVDSYTQMNRIPCIGTISLIAKFMGPTWGPPGSSRPQIGPMLAPWTLLSGMGFNSTGCYAGTPDLDSVMDHMETTRLSSVLGMDIRTVCIKLWKLGILSCRHWYTKIHVIHTLISVTDSKLFAAIRGSVWARYGERVIIPTNFFCTHTMLSRLILHVFPHIWLNE